MEEKCCCSHKTKERSEDEYKKLIHRLNRIEGQVRGLRGTPVINFWYTDGGAVQKISLASINIM